MANVFGAGNQSGSSYIAGAYSGRPVTVTRDIGGFYNEYAAATDYLARTGTPVTVKGSCISGCTLALSLPKSQVRVSPNAVFKIHGAYNRDTGAQAPDVTRDMVSRYQPEIQEIIRRRGIPAGRSGGAHLNITGRELIQMGWPSADARQPRARMHRTEAPPRSQPQQYAQNDPFAGVRAFFASIFG